MAMAVPDVPLIREDGAVQEDLGPQLRAMRRRQRMTLKDVATRAQISEGFLSQVERGLAGASLPTLHRIAEALQVTVADLFEPDQSLRPRVVRHADRSKMEFKGWRNYLVTPRPLSNLEVFWIELDPQSSTADFPFTHGNSDEVFILLTGEVVVRVNGQPHELKAGDSIAYSSSLPHSASNIGDTIAEAIISLSPPSM